MDQLDQSHQTLPADSGLQKSSLAGGFHSRGVPSGEGESRKHVRVLKIGDRIQQIKKSRPLTGGIGAEQASAAQLAEALKEVKWAADTRFADRGATGSMTAFVIAKKGCDFLDTPVFHAGESGEEEALALFTTRQQAQRYLDRAGWGEADEVGELSPGDLLQWLVAANEDGVRYATVNPDRERHLAGDPQPVLSLDALGDKSQGSLFQEVADLAQD